MENKEKYNIDEYYRRLKKAKDDVTTIKVYCDASQKGDVIVSGIKVFRDGQVFASAKEVKVKTILEAENYAIEMAIDYICQNHIKKSIIYTEMNEMIQAYSYFAVLNKIGEDIGNKKMRHNYRKNYRLWQKIKGAYAQYPHLFLCKVNSEENPAHETVCNQRQQILREQAGLLNRTEKNIEAKQDKHYKFSKKKAVLSVLHQMIDIVEKWSD